MLSTIKTSKSAGHDRIPGKLLRDAADVVAPSLTAIFNASINTGIFPEDFKIAVISPIHKAGSKTNCDGRSFIYNNNRSGPILEPWGIPHLTVLVLDIV